MVILFVTPYFGIDEKKARGGGLEVYLYRVASALKKRGHTPIIVSLGTDDMHYINNGFEVFFVKSPNIQLGKGKVKQFSDRVFKSLIVNRKIGELIKEKKIDIIQFASPYGLSLCYYGRVPAVMRLSSYSKLLNNYEDFDKEKIEVWAMCERLASRRCNAVFAPSEFIAKIFSEDIHRPVSVIESPFWNDCEIGDESVYQEKLRNKKYVLFFGRLNVDKGIVVIAGCIHRFLQLNPEYYFACCGDEEYINGRKALSTLKKAAGEFQDRIIYMKSMPHKTLYPIIQHADFVICPSLIENFSNSCIEAMYFERVVIGTNGVSYDQLIDDGESGLLCELGNAESLLKKMNEAAEMSELQKEKMGRKARKRIDRLAPEFVVKKLLRYYQYVIDGMS